MNPQPRAAERRMVEQPGKPQLVDRPPSEERTEDQAAPLFSGAEAQKLRSRWDEIQTGFVDEPRRAVEQADGLVAETIKRLAEIVSDERSKLGRQWDRRDNVSTEDLRLALRRCRFFFDRLLSV